jgi:predicted nucleotidyltransferase
MLDIETLKKEIVQRLKPLNPQKIILFGSYAYGKPNEDSDVDLYVVTKDEFIPKSWKEKSDIYLGVSKRLRDLGEIIAIDLIVHTKGMHNKFKELDSMFSRKILKEGKVLL